MASLIWLGIRRDHARKSIDESIKKLSSAFEVEIPSVPKERSPNDAEHLHMLELERIAKQLESVVDGIVPPVEELEEKEEDEYNGN